MQTLLSLQAAATRRRKNDPNAAPASAPQAPPPQLKTEDADGSGQQLSAEATKMIEVFIDKMLTLGVAGIKQVSDLLRPFAAG